MIRSLSNRSEDVQSAGSTALAENLGGTATMVEQLGHALAVKRHLAAVTQCTRGIADVIAWRLKPIKASVASLRYSLQIPKSTGRGSISFACTLLSVLFSSFFVLSFSLELYMY